MKAARRLVSAFLICVIFFSSIGLNTAVFTTQATDALSEEQIPTVSEETIASDDADWLPPEARLTEEEIAALDPPPVTDEEIAANAMINSEQLTADSTIVPYTGISAISTMSVESITSGIEQFQAYINTNLPMTYLGTALAVDGSCGPLTQTAAIKLIQYKLNQLGANLSIDGGFGTLTQEAFSEYVGTIERYETGIWVYILQGLLYCHAYDPGGFDGSYGANGGTGCLDAVNLFKSVNVISEGTSGTVGIETMKCLVWRIPTRVVDDGVYYIKNYYSGYYANVEDGKINTLTNIQQETQNTANGISRLRQLWKIHYLGGGYYTLRPMHKLNMGMSVYNNGAVINYLIATDQLSNIPSEMRWSITQSGSVFVFQHNGDTSKKLCVADTTVGSDLSLLSGSSLRAFWILEEVDPAPEGLLLYNSTSSAASTSLTRHMAPGQTKTLDELHIKPAVYSGNTISQTITWESLDTSRATVDSSTGMITAKAYGSLTIRGKKYLGGAYKYVYIDLEVSHLPNGVYRIENKHSAKNIDIENQNMNSGTIIHQWQYHRGSTQKWGLVLREDGYYVIYSQREPAYYLSVDGSSDSDTKPVILQTAPVTDELQWKIFSTSSGAYRIISRVGIGSRVLSLESQSTDNGIDLQYTVYENDTNYIDEWEFRPLRDYSLFYIGEDDGDPHMPPLLSTVKSALDNNAGLFGHAATSGTKSEVLDAFAFSKIFSSISHGNQISLDLASGGTITISDIEALPDDAFVNLKLVYFGACKTGEGGAAATNLVNTMYSKGAGAVVGFTVNVDAAACIYWTELFMQELSMGHTFNTSLANADEDFKEATVFPENEQNQIKSRLQQGNLYVSIE